MRFIFTSLFARNCAKNIFYLTVFGLWVAACGSGGAESTGGNGDGPSSGSGTPIGLSSFALGVAAFPTRDFLDVSKTTRQVATNELFTFPEAASREKITATLKGLLEEGYDVFHEIHILNGPGMRVAQDYWINGVVGKKTSDEEFVQLLKTSRIVQRAVDTLFAQVVAEARALEALGAEVVICPELEDNHKQNDSYDVLVNALVRAGWSDTSKIVRNTYVGSARSDLRREVHTRSLAELKSANLQPGDIQNNDGVTIGSTNGTIPSDELLAMASYAQSRGIIFYLWVAESQGLQHVTGGEPWQMEVIGDYRKRRYSFPDVETYRSIISAAN